jgi:hypothetical protein
MNAFQQTLEAQRTPRRAARLIACLVIGLLLPGQISSLFGQHITTVIHDVSDMADGSVTQARLEAQRQIASGDLAYRSYGKGDPRSFSGKYTAPELPEEKKGRFVYGLALFSDDGCNVKVNGSVVHERLGKGQHLPNINDSFHVLQTALAPGEPTDITVDYSNTIYNDDPDSSDYPDIDGCTLFLYLIPAGIAVDANRDGTIAFSGDSRDTTSQDAPFRFWINDDNDGHPGSEGDVIDEPSSDYKNLGVQTARDFEDFVRLHLFFDAFQKELSGGTLKIGLKFKGVEGTLPKVKLYKSNDSEGSDSYLKDDQAAFAQLSGENAQELGEVINNPMFLPQDFWTGNDAGSKKCLLFEAGAEGKGKLVMTINKPNGTEVGEGPSVWLDLKNVKKMYVRAKATPEFIEYPRNYILEYPPEPQISFVSDPNGHPFEAPPDEAKQVIVFVHGINGPGDGGSAASYDGWVNVAETVFKRLWHQGYRGRFAFYKWPALTPAFPFEFNDSEYRAWKCGRGLATLVNSFPESFGKNLYSFSQGAPVCGAALTVYGLTVDNYVMSQAAAPAGCYDTSESINSYADFLVAETENPTPDASNDLGYRGYLTRLSVSGTVVSFYNTVDYALKTGREVGQNTSWEGNQLSYKPHWFVGRHYEYDTSASTGQRCKLRINDSSTGRYVVDIHESMSFIARPRSEAAGASASVAGRITGRYNVGPDTPSNFRDGASEHGGQFSYAIQRVWPYYENLLRVLTEE